MVIRAFTHSKPVMFFKIPFCLFVDLSTLSTCPSIDFLDLHLVYCYPCFFGHFKFGTYSTQTNPSPNCHEGFCLVSFILQLLGIQVSHGWAPWQPKFFMHGLMSRRKWCEIWCDDFWQGSGNTKIWDGNRVISLFILWVLIYHGLKNQILGVSLSHQYSKMIAQCLIISCGRSAGDTSSKASFLVYPC